MHELCAKHKCCPWLPPTQSFAPGFVGLHVSDQSHCVFMPGGESIVDFIGATERIDDDWAAIVQHINERAGTHFRAVSPSMINGRGPLTSVEASSGCKANAKLSEEAKQNIAQQYAQDVVRFGYL